MKAVIIGKSSTGKSSLLRLLSSEFPCIEEVAREVLTDDRYKDQIPQVKQTFMMYKQWEREGKMPRFISDRGLHDYVVYSDRLGVNTKFYQAELSGRYDFVFKLPNTPFRPDGTRVEKDDHEAQELQDRIERLYMDTDHTLIEVPNVDLVKRFKFIESFLKQAR